MARTTAPFRLLALALISALTLGVAALAGAAEPTLKAGFGVRAITPVGEPPAEWAQYFTPQPTTGVWGEPFEDLDGNGCMSGLNNENLGPLLDGEPPRGENPEPHVDQPWNSAGNGYDTGAFSVRGVTIIGDPDSTGKWDGLWANAGFGSKCATGMHDDTWARAVVLEVGDETVAMVSLDVVGLFNIEVQRARKEMQIRYPDMPIDELVVSSTHTHEGVDTMGYWGQLYLNTDGKFPAYQAFIRSQIIDAIHDAWTTRDDARVKLAVGSQPIGIRDSRPPQVKDPSVPAAQFVRGDGSTIGTIVNWSNHPEAQGSRNSLISSDFAHGARETLEQTFDGTAIYFSGSVGGLQTPLGQLIPGFGTDPSWERTFEIGRLVAAAAEAALAEVEPIEITSLNVQRRSWYMDMDNGALRALNMTGIFDIPTYTAGEAWGPPSGHRDGVYSSLFGSQIQTEMVSVELGPAVFVTVPGELSPELVVGGYGRPEPDCPDTGRPYEPTIESSWERPVRFILGLGQDELGYIIPGYDFWITSVPEQRDDGRGVFAVGALEVEHCGEGHYEETVSGSSVMAPWVACVAKELAGKDPWSDTPENAACSYENTHRPPYGLDPAGG